jgi:hypothetical protein
MGRITWKHLFRGTLIVLMGLVFVFVPFSLLVGWNIFTLFFFWFMTVPALTLYLPAIISRNKNHLLESLTGMIIFYGLMVFMIYDHYQTDYFQVMMVSCGFNLLIVTLFSLLIFKHSKSKVV